MDHVLPLWAYIPNNYNSPQSPLRYNYDDNPLISVVVSFLCVILDLSVRVADLPTLVGFCGFVVVPQNATNPFST